MTTETTTLSIVGYEPECNCDHCGRELLHGIRTNRMGILGADCFRAMIVPDRKRFSKGRPEASYIRTLAKLRERSSDERLRLMGYDPARHFKFAVYVID